MIFIKDVLHQATVRFALSQSADAGWKPAVFLHQVELHFTLRICNNYCSLYTLMYIYCLEKSPYLKKVHIHS